MVHGNSGMAMKTWPIAARNGAKPVLEREEVSPVVLLEANVAQTYQTQSLQGLDMAHRAALDGEGPVTLAPAPAQLIAPPGCTHSRQ